MPDQEPQEVTPIVPPTTINPNPPNFGSNPGEITFKQENFAQEWVKNGGNGTKAALAAGYSPSKSYGAAAVAASNELNNSKVQSRIRQIADKVGLTVDACLETVNRGLNAKKPLVIGRKVEHFADNPSQLRAAELGLKVHGALADGANSNRTDNPLDGGSWSRLILEYHKGKDK